MSNKTILVVEHPYACGDHDDYYGSGEYLAPTIRTFASFDDLMKDPEFTQELRTRGFVNKKDILDTKKPNEKLFFYVPSNPHGYYPTILQVTDREELASMVNSYLGKFAKGEAFILQGVDSKNILSKDTLDKIEKEKKTIKAREQAAKKAAETKKAKKREKEIEKAKKILEEANEI